MIKNLYLAAGLVFISSTLAQACSVSVENRKGEFNFDRLSPTIYKQDWSPFDENALDTLGKGQVPFDLILQSKWVYIAKAEIKDTNITLPNFNNHPLNLVEFKVLETIKGKSTKSIWYSDDGKNITPILDVTHYDNKENITEKLKVMTDEMISSHNSFAFWDTQILPKMTWSNPYSSHSCGPEPLPQISELSHYIIFQSSLGEIKYIPIANKNDLLVQTLKTAITKKSRVRLPLSVETYFRNMKYAVPVELNCKSSIKNANRGNDWWDPFTKFSFDKIGAKFKVIKGPAVQKPASYLGNIEKPREIDLLNDDWPALFAFYPNRDLKLLTCSAREEFLMYQYEDHEISSSDLTNHNADWVRLPKYRFAKIVDGKILTASIKTNFALYGDDRIPLETIINWVEQKSPESLVEANPEN